jgi:hypothetical protein
MKILIVDDDPRIREALATGLQLQWKDAAVIEGNRLDDRCPDINADCGHKRGKIWGKLQNVRDRLALQAPMDPVPPSAGFPKSYSYSSSSSTFLPANNRTRSLSSFAYVHLSQPASNQIGYRLEAYATLRRRAVAEGPWSDRQEGLEMSLSHRGRNVG